MPTDRALVLLAREGDHDAFTTLVATSVDRLYAVARLILRDDHGAEDAVQEGLVRAWLNIRGLRDPDRFDAWTHRLVVHACYRLAKRERRRQLVEVQSLQMDRRAGDDRQQGLADRDQLERAFRHLTVEQRAVLAVRYVLDLPEAQAAQILDIPIGTMKSRLSRATVALRAAVAADDRTPVLAEGRIA